MAEVVRNGVAETVGFGAFDHLLVIEEWTPLSPSVIEEKYYASGIGVVLETTVRGGSGRIELIEYRRAG